MTSIEYLTRGQIGLKFVKKLPEFKEKLPEIVGKLSNFVERLTDFVKSSVTAPQ